MTINILKRKTCNQRFLFIEKKNDQFIHSINLHNQVLNELNNAPLTTLGQKNYIYQFFPKRNYFWVGSDFLGPTFELEDQDFIFYDMINRQIFNVTYNIDKTNLTLDKIFSIYDMQIRKYKKNMTIFLDESSFQLIISEEDEKIFCNFIFFQSITHV